MSPNYATVTDHDWASSMDAGFQSDVFILDFSKAFDIVPHERLKTKLFHYGVNGTRSAGLTPSSAIVPIVS